MSKPLLPAATPSTPFVSASTPAISASSNAPLKFNGWLFKFAVGNSTFGRKNWQLRYFESNLDTITYWAAEPFSPQTAKRVIRWRDVLYVYDVLNSAVHKQASDPERFYFGIRFYSVHGSDLESILVLRTDVPADRSRWVAHLYAVFLKLNPTGTVAGGGGGALSKAFADMQPPLPGGSITSASMMGQQPQGGGLQRRSASSRGWLVEAVANPLRNLVSLQKKRYQEGGFNLDLAYIDEDIIAMGYPSEGTEGLFRNPMDEVVKFLEERHGKQYHIFNLCSERFYPPSAFEGKFDRFPFDDHNAPPIDILFPFCHRAAEILRRPPDPRTGRPWAVSVHCKAGKGRTGAMICALLMYLGRCANDKEALEYFARKRTKDGKGVQIPSQIRYINYFYQMRAIYGDTVPPPVKVTLKTLILSSIPRFDSDGGADPFVVVQARRETHGHRALGTTEGNVHNPLVTLLDTRTATPARHVIGVENYAVEIGATVSGDVRIKLLDQDGFGKDELMAAFWINTSFLPPGGVLVFKKHELDNAVKEKVKIDPGFHVTLKYEIHK